MDLRQLNALVAVADHGSFSAAARALHTVQSNVSTHVARLERELGATLIDRSTGTLTGEGAAVATRARRIQTELDALSADVASLHDDVAGTVRLGVIGTTARWLVSPLMKSMHDRHPKVRILVLDATTTALLPQLEAGQLDLAVVNLPIAEPDVSTEVLFEEDHMVAIPEDHPLAGRSKLAMADLDMVPLLLEPQGTGFRDHLDAQAAAAGITLVPQAEIDGMRLLASLALQGLGAAVLPASATAGWPEGGCTRVPLDDLDRRSVGLARRRRGLASAPSRALQQVLREVIDKSGPLEAGIHPVHP
jgi:molybdate transport repressor ModE-like protein